MLLTAQYIGHGIIFKVIIEKDVIFFFNKKILGEKKI